MGIGLLLTAFVPSVAAAFPLSNDPTPLAVCQDSIRVAALRLTDDGRRGLGACLIRGAECVVGGEEERSSCCERAARRCEDDLRKVERAGERFVKYVANRRCADVAFEDVIHGLGYGALGAECNALDPPSPPADLASLLACLGRLELSRTACLIGTIELPRSPEALACLGFEERFAGVTGADLTTCAAPLAPSPTASSAATPAATVTPTAATTGTASSLATATVTPRPATATPSATATPALLATQTATVTASSTRTASPIPTTTATRTVTPTAVTTGTTPLPTVTPTPLPGTATASATGTPVPLATQTATATASSTRTATPTPTVTATTLLATVTAPPQPTASVTPVPTKTATATTTTTPTRTASPVPTATATATPTGPFCGNGVKDAGEDCDDGNQRSCDECPSNCRLAPVACPTAGRHAQTIHLARTDAQPLTSALFCLEYPVGTVALPGTGLVTQRVSGFPGLTTVNDFNNAARVGLVGQQQLTQISLSLSLDLCTGATAPLSDAFVCNMISASSSGTSVDPAIVSCTPVTP